MSLNTCNFPLTNKKRSLFLRKGGDANKKKRI